MINDQNLDNGCGEILWHSGPSFSYVAMLVEMQKVGVTLVGFLCDAAVPIARHGSQLGEVDGKE